MKNAGKARSYGLYRHLRTSKEIIENLLNYYIEKRGSGTHPQADEQIHNQRLPFNNHIASAPLQE